MSRFSHGMGSIAGAGAVVLVVISTALARGPYAGVAPASRRAADSEAEATATAASGSARVRVDPSAPKPTLTGGKTAAVAGDTASAEPSVLPGADVRQILLDL